MAVGLFFRISPIDCYRARVWAGHGDLNETLGAGNTDQLLQTLAIISYMLKHVIANYQVIACVHAVKGFQIE